MISPQRLGLTFMVVGVLICAGCFTGDDPSEETEFDPWADLPDPLPDGDGHEHSNYSQHNFTSPNMEFVDWDTLGDNGGAEISVHEDYAYVASWTEIYIVDISDPHNLVPVSFWHSEDGSMKDVKVLRDGDYLLVNHEYPDVALDPNGGPAQQNVPPYGTTLVDVRDKENPRTAARWSSEDRPGLGPHNVFAHQIDGEWYAFLAHSDFIAQGTGDDWGGIIILHIDFSVPEVPVMVEIGEFEVPPAETNGGWIFIHDMTVQTWPDPDDPVHGGKTYIYAAYWDAGLRIVDVSDPPDRLSQTYLTNSWSPPEVANWYEDLTIDLDNLSNIHYVEPYPELIQFDDGSWHHITIAAPEVLTAEGGTGQSWILDTTDHDNIEILGTYEIADNKPYGGDTWLMFSPHNLDTGNGRIYTSNYHAGIWVIDIHDEEHLRNPEIMGWHVPSPAQDPEADPGYTEQYGFTHVPFIWAVEYDNGYIYASDITTGIYVVQLEDDIPFDDRVSS